MTNITTTAMTEAVAKEWRQERAAFETRVRAEALTPSSVNGEREQAYALALALVAGIDEELRRRHYRSRSGRLLTTLDQVVQAILNDDLATEETELWQQN